MAKTGKEKVFWFENSVDPKFTTYSSPLCETRNKNDMRAIKYIKEHHGKAGLYVAENNIAHMYASVQKREDTGEISINILIRYI